MNGRGMSLQAGFAESREGSDLHQGDVVTAAQELRFQNGNFNLATARHGEQSAFERMGGREGINQLAKRFYEVMSERPSSASIRAMHANDLGPVTESLGEFLMGWIGGPRDWFMRPGRPCIMSLHRALPIGENERDQWLLCMKQALSETVADDELRGELEMAFYRTADAMRSR